MKLIHVYGDDDYAVLTLQQDTPYRDWSYKRLHEEAMNNHGSWEFADGCYIDSYEFENVVVTDGFIEFLNSIKDHDSIKHSDWFIVKEE